MTSHWYPTLWLIFTFSFPKLFIFVIFIFSNEIMLTSCYRMDLKYPPQTYIVKACSVCTIVVPGGSEIFQTWGLGGCLQIISGMFLKETMDLSLLFLASLLFVHPGHMHPPWYFGFSKWSKINRVTKSLAETSKTVSQNKSFQKQMFC